MGALYSTAQPLFFFFSFPFPLHPEAVPSLNLLLLYFTQRQRGNGLYPSSPSLIRNPAHEKESSRVPPRSFQTVVSRTTVNINGSKLFPSFLPTHNSPSALCLVPPEDRRQEKSMCSTPPPPAAAHTHFLNWIDPNQVLWCADGWGEINVCVVFPFFSS